MPDSQNTQGEQSDTPRTDAAVMDARKFHGDMWASQIPKFARQLERELSLFSQQHAPSKEVGERISNLNWELSHNVDAGGGIDALEKWVTALRKGSAIKSMRITELATELTKGLEAERVKYEAQLKAIKEDRDAILDDRDSLRQQLAEAKEKLSKVECDLLPHYAAIKAGDKLVEELRTQNIALSAVVENMKEALEAGQGIVFEGTPHRAIPVDLVDHALALQPDLSLYGRIVETLQQVLASAWPNKKEHPAMRSAWDSVTQLLADLGHK